MRHSLAPRRTGASDTVARPGTRARIELGERLEREAALVEAGCGTSGPARRSSPPVEEEVEVDRARPDAGTPSRVRPSERSISSRTSSSSRGASSVSTATAPFRNRGWSTTPSGSVSRSPRSPPRRCPRGSRPARRPGAGPPPGAEVRAEADVRSSDTRILRPGAGRAAALRPRPPRTRRGGRARRRACAHGREPP